MSAPRRITLTALAVLLAAVTGSFRVAEMGLTGSMEGTLVGDRLTFRGAYRNPESGCEGVTEATATVGQGGATLSGAMTVVECGQTLAGSLSFRR